MIDNQLLSCDNGVDPVVEADATTVAREYYTSYAKYVLEYRALPSVYDGLKPVQRRIIYTANQFPHKLMKTAKLSGAVLAYHPHGSSSVTGAINEMAHPLNALPLFTTKGNFGGVGFGASADRYTECYLSEIARMNFCQFIDYADYEIGEIGENEPSALPTLIPYALFKGSEGIGVGLSTKVMPLNLIDLIDYYIDYIKRDGSSNKFVKPDVGYVILNMTDEEIRTAVDEYKGRIQVASIPTQISSNTFLIEGLYDRSIDAVINKIDKWYGWFSKEQVGFRDASTSSVKYIFEIYDENAVTPQMLKEVIVSATKRAGTYTRVFEEDSSAVYSPFQYVVRKSLECLNKAIDKKINTELARHESQLHLYEVLKLCKNAGVFDKVTTMTAEQLVDLIVRTSSCTDEVAREIIKKPISYLTRSHEKDEEDIKLRIEDLKSHDRKKYLIKLYKDFRRAVLPIYEERKHTITPDMLIKTPCIKIDSPDDIRVTDGDGLEFDSTVYFVGSQGNIYKRSISSTAASSVVVETWGDEIVGASTDKSKYIMVTSETDHKGWICKTILSVEDVKYDKKFINLREDCHEKIISVEGIDVIPKEYSSALRGSRVSQTTYFKTSVK